jgi:hypothetical protein
MGRKHRQQASLLYEFRLDDMIPKGHLLRRINVFVTSVLGSCLAFGMSFAAPRLA